MKAGKVINLEEAIQKRETPLIQKYSREEDYEKVDKIIVRII